MENIYMYIYILHNLLTHIKAVYTASTQVFLEEMKQINLHKNMVYLMISYITSDGYMHNTKTNEHI